MEPDLNLRYKSAEELLADLEEFRKNPGIIFSYINNNTVGHVSSEHRNSSDKLIANDRGAIIGQPTREVPSGAILKAESSLPKTGRTPVRSPELVRDDYSSRANKKTSRSSTLVAVLLISIVLIGLFGFIFVTFIMPIINPPAEEFITIPKFVGQVYDDIINNPEYNTVYSFKPEYVNNDTVDAGVVISQDPPADRKQTPPATGLIDIKLTVSLGVQQVVNMPDFTNKDWRAAFTELENKGMNLNIQTSSEPSNDIIKDYVIRTEPQAGTTLTEGSTVFIIYSSGQITKTVKVPDVQGLPLSQAISRIEGYGLTWDVQYEENADVPKNYVIFQDLTPETEVAEKTKIVLTVSNGPTSSSTPTSSSSPTPTETSSPTPGTP
jgi:serine/threonine-protein kinase